MLKYNFIKLLQKCNTASQQPPYLCRLTSPSLPAIKTRRQNDKFLKHYYLTSNKWSGKKATLYLFTHFFSFGWFVKENNVIIIIIRKKYINLKLTSLVHQVAAVTPTLQLCYGAEAFFCLQYSVTRLLLHND